MTEPDLLELTPRLFRLRVPGGAAHLLNAYLWLQNGDVTLIDTGWKDSAQLISRSLEALGVRRSALRRIVLTHFHEDNAGAASALTTWSDVEVVAGAPDAPYLRGAQLGPLPKLTAKEAAIHPPGDTPPQGPPCRVDRTVASDGWLDGTGSARVLMLPGHTPGSIGLHLPAEDAVITGDAAAEFHGQVILGVFNVDREAAAQALGTIGATEANIACFGHGEAIRSHGAALVAAAGDPFADSVAG